MDKSKDNKKIKSIHKRTTIEEIMQGDVVYMGSTKNNPYCWPAPEISVGLIACKGNEIDNWPDNEQLKKEIKQAPKTEVQPVKGLCKEIDETDNH